MANRLTCAIVGALALSAQLSAAIAGPSEKPEGGTTVARNAVPAEDSATTGAAVSSEQDRSSNSEPANGRQAAPAVASNEGNAAGSATHGGSVGVQEAAPAMPAPAAKPETETATPAKPATPESGANTATKSAETAKPEPAKPAANTETKSAGTQKPQPHPDSETAAVRKPEPSQPAAKPESETAKSTAPEPAQSETGVETKTAETAKPEPRTAAEPGQSSKVPAPAMADISERLEKSGRARTDYDKSARKAIATFYAGRDNAPFWTDKDGFTPAAVAAIAEISKANDWGLEAGDYKLPAADSAFDLDETKRADLEIRLSLVVLQYAHHARGGRVDPGDLSYDIDLRPTFKDPEVVLAELSKAGDAAAYLRGLHPQSAQFKLLRKEYLRLLHGDEKASAPRVNEAAYKTARQAAERDGLPPPPRPNFIKRKNAEPSPQARLTRLKRNMEMWRWMPADLGETYILANIPAFVVRIFEGGKETFQERIIVGKVKNQTPVFSDEMEKVVFRPLWHVPNSIKVKELLPGLARGGDPVSRQGLRMKIGGREVNPRSINWGRTDIRNVHVYQPSGPGNALGFMKFLFPNKHAVYMHDTPSRHLFKNSQRAYSHGCVRTRNPMDYAIQLLRIGKGWSAAKTRQTFKASAENTEIVLERKIPVYIVYFTAWANPQTGQVSYFNDLYRHEKHLQYALDGKTHLIVKTKPNVNSDYQRIRASILARQQREQENQFWSPWGSNNPGNPGYSSRDPNWRRRAFGGD